MRIDTEATSTAHTVPVTLSTDHAGSAEEIVRLRRDLHAHPEVAFAEARTTAVIVEHLSGLGLSPRVLPRGTGAICDLGGAAGPLIALRADIDALPLDDPKDVAYRSQLPGVCHACGHDAHTAILLGVASALAGAELPGRVRLIFQPGEEQMPGGALDVIAAGGMDDVAQIYALHCDPRLDAGLVGLRTGGITAACDHVEIQLTGSGGHTARPHLTGDVVYALGRLITEVPGLLSRRVDPRAALSLVWGAVEAGHAANAIPADGTLRGTVRVFDRDAWHAAEGLIRSLVEEVAVSSGVRAVTSYRRGVPPVVNDAGAVDVQRAAVVAALGPDALADTAQSMGGEDFAWYLDHAPGALARLGVAKPGVAERLDLHQGTFDLDETALDVGVRFTVALAHA
ncbi:MAG TPA: amidohydrolase, partial [Jatrophihabitantaceae bacterium]|nr:amidohydrolase [Jatrophihabitantaceae bacterium]